MQRRGTRKKTNLGSEGSASGSSVLSGDKVASRELELPKSMTVHQLALEMKIDPVEVIKELIRNGIMANINQVIDFDIASDVAGQLGFEAKPTSESKAGLSEGIAEIEDDPANQVVRPPVVTILGHVDHGKTTLLDAIRESNVTEREAGGITQHIGAYQVEFRGQKITFLDTPGHEAFTAMRARGAKATDIAVLVVAADDGVMPQTVEAMDHARSADVPIVVAINKMDVEGSDPDKVKRQLVERGLVIEEWGGEVIAIPVSAKTGDGIDDLLENLLVVAEISELKADPGRSAVGVIVESRVDKSRGPVATVLVQAGTLRIGETVVVGSAWGRIKAMITESGQRIHEAGPSSPVEILGLGEIPNAGDTLWAVPNEKMAKDLIQKRKLRLESERQMLPASTLEDASNRIGGGEATDLNLIVKTDVQGSVDAVRGVLDKLSSERGRVNIIHAAAGSINEGDVLLAVASSATIIGFNVRVEPGAKRISGADRVDIRLYEIIYRLAEDVQDALEGMLAPVTKEVVEGHADVRAIFSMGRRNKIAGVYVNDGRIVRNSSIRVIRGAELVHQGPISSLKHFKDDVREMGTGFECGVGIEGFNDFEVGDVLEVVTIT